MDRAVVEKTCLDASKNGIVSPANYNSSGQIIIAGENNPAEKTMELAKAAGENVLNVVHQKSMNETLIALGL